MVISKTVISKTSFFTVLLSSLAWTQIVAACPDDAEVLVSCSLKKGQKTLQTCLREETVSYAFGATGRKPDLELRRHVTEVDLAPWPGVGSSIWEEFSLENKGVRYLVHYGMERSAQGGQSALYGGVTVEQNGKVLAQLDCDVGSVVSAGYPLPLFEAKEAAGQTYSHESHSWQ